MSRYFVRRILETIPLMLIISIFVFMFIHLIPGDPARSIAGLDAEEWDAGELLGRFIGYALRILGVPDPVKSISGLMITVPALTRLAKTVSHNGYCQRMENGLGGEVVSHCSWPFKAHRTF